MLTPPLTSSNVASVIFSSYWFCKPLLCSTILSNTWDRAGISMGWCQKKHKTYRALEAWNSKYFAINVLTYKYALC